MELKPFGSYECEMCGDKCPTTRYCERSCVRQLKPGWNDKRQTIEWFTDADPYDNRRCPHLHLQCGCDYEWLTETKQGGK
jgi:hypothetical protein